jgi:hypothetical protein
VSNKEHWQSQWHPKFKPSESTSARRIASKLGDSSQTPPQIALTTHLYTIAALGREISFCSRQMWLFPALTLPGAISIIRRRSWMARPVFSHKLVD